MGLQIGHVGTAGVTRARQKSMNQVDGDSCMVPTYWLCGSTSQKRNNDLCQHFCLGEAAPPALALMPDNSVPLCISLIPFKLLPGFGAQRVWIWVNPCVGTLKGTAWGLQKPLPHSASISAGFTARSYGDFSSWQWNPVLRLWCYAGTPHSSGGCLCSQDIPPDFKPPHMDVGQTHSTFLPLLPSTMWLLI